MFSRYDAAIESERRYQTLEPPSLVEIRRFREAGISIDALCEPELPARAAVVFCPDQPFFDFVADVGDDGAVLAFIFLARDEDGEPCDLVAWAPKAKRMAAWYGAAEVLGEDHLAGPRLEEGLRVCADPLEWLHAERCGVVILDAGRARWRLAGEPLIVGNSDAMFGRRLRDALRLPEPRIFVEKAGRAAA